MPSFDTFSCPSILPKEWYEDETWIEVSPIRQVDRRDQTCRVTGDLLPNVAAYVIPRVHKEWWKRNGMFAHAENPGSAQGPHCNDNAILLRRDVRRLWDDNHIAIVPKAGKWVVHVLNMDQTDAFVGFYQNLELQTLYNIPSQYLLYRFALAILSKSVFFDQGVPRKSVTADTKDPSHLYLYPSESEQPV